MRKRLLNAALIASLTFGVTSAAFADHMGHEHELAHAIKHANFMPTLMMHTLKNAEALGLNQKQVEELKAYKSANSSAQQEDMKQVMILENQAAEAGLNKDLAAAKTAGDKSIALRQAIFNQKLECYQKVQSILSAEQFEKLKTMAQKPQKH
jgi:hypothetical protein